MRLTRWFKRQPSAARHRLNIESGRHVAPLTIREKFVAMVSVATMSVSLVVIGLQGANATTVLVAEEFSGPSHGIAQAQANGWEIGGSGDGCNLGSPWVSPEMVDSSGGSVVDRLRLTRVSDLCSTGYALYNVAQTTSAGLDVNFNLAMSGAGGGYCPARQVDTPSYNSVVDYDYDSVSEQSLWVANSSYSATTPLGNPNPLYEYLYDSYGGLVSDSNGVTRYTVSAFHFESQIGQDGIARTVLVDSYGNPASYAQVFQPDFVAGTEQINTFAAYTNMCQADGFVFYLKKGSDNSQGGASLGSAGGSLGYAPQNSQIPGVSGALLGIGFDAYGNAYQKPFSGADCSDANYQDPSATDNSRRSLVVRGAQGADRMNGYCQVATANDRVVSGRNYGVPLPDTMFTMTGMAARIVIDPQDTNNGTYLRGTIRIYLAPANTSNWSEVTRLQIPVELANSPTFKFGFVAGTGGGTMNADLWSPTVETVHQLNPVGFQTASLSFCATNGNAVNEQLAGQYGVQPYNFSLFSGTLPAGVTLTSGGLLSGTPPANTAQTSFTVRITDALNASHEDRLFSIKSQSVCSSSSSSFTQAPSASNSSSSSPSPTSSSSSSASASASASASPSSSASPSVSASPSSSVSTPSVQNTPSSSPSPTSSPSVSASASPTVAASPAATAISTPSASPRPSASTTANVTVPPTNPRGSSTDNAIVVVAPTPTPSASQAEVAPSAVPTQSTAEAAPVATTEANPLALVAQVAVPKADPAIGATGDDSLAPKAFAPLETAESAKRYMALAAWFIILIASSIISALGRERKSLRLGSLVGVDAEIEYRRQRKLGWGDRLPIFKLKLVTLLDKFSADAIRVTYPKSPILAKIFNEGAYLRAYFGSFTIITSLATAALGVYAALSRDMSFVMPATWLLLAIVAIGVFDSFAGLLGSFALVVTTLLTMQSGTIQDYRTLLGLFVLGFAPALSAEAFRSVRRRAEKSGSYVWERISDFAIAPFIGGVSTIAMVSALPALANLTLPVANHVVTFGIVAAIGLFLRVALEEFAGRAYPARMDLLNPDDLEQPTRLRKFIGILVKAALYIFVSTSIFGLGWQVWVACLIFVIPALMHLFQDRLPNSRTLWRFLPKGIPGMAFSLVLAFVTVTMVTWLVRDPATMARYGFMLLAVPALLLTALHVLGRHGQDGEVKPIQRPERKWLYRLGGVVMYGATVWLVANA